MGSIAGSLTITAVSAAEYARFVPLVTALVADPVATFSAPKFHSAKRTITLTVTQPFSAP